jgi:putative hydrolase of the HAD superfamily
VPLLLLDLDNTLVDRAAAYRSWAQTFVNELDGNSDDVEWLVPQDGDGLAPREGLARAMAQRSELRASSEAAVVQTLRQGLVEHMTLDPEVAGRLLYARDAGWTAVVVTNGTVTQARAQEP